MRQYQVTRKRQVTIPKELADKTGIRPGDSVMCESIGDSAIVLKKTASAETDSEQVKSAIEAFVKEAAKMRKYLREGVKVCAK